MAMAKEKDIALLGHQRVAEMRTSGFMVVGTDSGRDDVPPITDALIQFVEGKIKKLSYEPGGKEVSPHDIAFVTGQSDILNQLRVLQSWQARQSKETTANGVPVQ